MDPRGGVSEVRISIIVSCSLPRPPWIAGPMIKKEVARHLTGPKARAVRWFIESSLSISQACSGKLPMTNVPIPNQAPTLDIKICSARMGYIVLSDDLAAADFIVVALPRACSSSQMAGGRVEVEVWV